MLPYNQTKIIIQAYKMVIWYQYCNKLMAATLLPFSVCLVISCRKEQPTSLPSCSSNVYTYNVIIFTENCTSNTVKKSLQTDTPVSDNEETVTINKVGNGIMHDNQICSCSLNQCHPMHNEKD